MCQPCKKDRESEPETAPTITEATQGSDSEEIGPKGPLLTIWHCGFWHRVQAHHVEVLVYPKRIYLPINSDQFRSILGSPILRNNHIRSRSIKTFSLVRSLMHLTTHSGFGFYCLVQHSLTVDHTHCDMSTA